MKGTTGGDTSKLGATSNLVNLKAQVNTLHLDELKIVLADLSKLSKCSR